MVYSSGNVTSDLLGVSNNSRVTPTLFLNSTETIYEDSADGTQDNPYKLTP